MSLVLAVGILSGMAAPAAAHTADPLTVSTIPAAGPAAGPAPQAAGALAQARPATVRPRPASSQTRPARPFRMPWHIGVF